MTKSNGRGSGQPAAGSPRDRFITVYGRIPVTEVLTADHLTVDKIVVADSAQGQNVDRIMSLARRRGVAVVRATAQRVKLLAGNGRHDQGIVADVEAPGMRSLQDYLIDVRQRDQRASAPVVFVLDGITNPSNVGMIVRSATAAGLDGIVLPRVGVAELGPLVIKASAGVAFNAPILNCRTAEEAVRGLSEAGFHVVGLAADGDLSIYEAPVTGPTAIVLGGESTGISPAIAGYVEEFLAIPMEPEVESLNVAVAAAVVGFEIRRARTAQRGRSGTSSGRDTPPRFARPGSRPNQPGGPARRR